MIERRRIEAVANRVLGPYLGQTMARAAIEGHLKRLGIDQTTLESRQFGDLMDRLRKGLTLFVGSENATQLTDQLVQELEGSEA